MKGCARHTFFEYDELLKREPVLQKRTRELYVLQVFDKVFGHNVAKTLEMDDLWKNRQRPKPLFIDEVGTGHVLVFFLRQTCRTREHPTCMVASFGNSGFESSDEAYVEEP